MEVNVKVTIDLGSATIAALSSILGAQATVSNGPKAEAVVKSMTLPAAPASTPAATPAPKIAATPSAPAKPAAPAPKAPAPKAATTEFADLSEEDQLENIKAHVTKHTKKGKSADIKALLSNFGAARASELTPDQYGEFNDAITRYSAGEAVEDIFPSLD